MSACLGGLKLYMELSRYHHTFFIHSTLFQNLCKDSHGLIDVSRTVAWSTSLYGMKPSSLFGVWVLLLSWQKQIRTRYHMIMMARDSPSYTKTQRGGWRWGWSRWSIRNSIFWLIYWFTFLSPKWISTLGEIIEAISHRMKTVVLYLT